MKAIVKVISMISLGVLLSMAACNSNKESNGGSMDSTGLDSSGSGMEADTMSSDSTK